MAKENWTWLRGLGPLGNGFANLITFATTNWLITLSALVAAGAAVWNATRDFFLLPQVWIAIGVFLALLWTSIGFAYLRDRKRARDVLVQQDLKYGLTYEGTLPVFIPTDSGGLQFFAQFRNFSAGPIKYSIDAFNVRIDTRSLPPIKPGDLVTYLPRGAVRTSRNVPFKMKDVREFLGSSVAAIVDVTVSYGHPEREPERQLVMQLEFDLTFPAPDNPDQRLGVADKIVSERDEPYVPR